VTGVLGAFARIMVAKLTLDLYAQIGLGGRRDRALKAAAH
jgi:hypothetical protein